jgi:hypothetical protein
MWSNTTRFGAALVLLLLAWGEPAWADTGMHLSGGGTASISQVAFNVHFDGSGTASGSFDCLMAGRSASVLPDFRLAHVMKVHATPTAGSVAGSTAFFSGPGTLILDGSQQMPIHVKVEANANTQQFRLTVVEVGMLPWETMVSGRFQIR